MSCLFNDPDELKRMDEGEHYIIIGNLDQWENDQGQMQDQVSPVRGVLSLEEAKELADAYVEGEVNDSVPTEEDMTGDSEDESSEDESDESDDDDDGLDGFLSGDDEEEDDEPDVDYDEVSGVVETLAKKDEVVWDLEEGDERVGKVVQITQKQLEIEGAEDKIEELVLKRIEEENEDDDDSDDSEEDRMF